MALPSGFRDACEAPRPHPRSVNLRHYIQRLQVFAARRFWPAAALGALSLLGAIVVLQLQILGKLPERPPTYGELRNAPPGQRNAVLLRLPIVRVQAVESPVNVAGSVTVNEIEKPVQVRGIRENRGVIVVEVSNPTLDVRPVR